MVYTHKDMKRDLDKYRALNNRIRKIQNNVIKEAKEFDKKLKTKLEYSTKDYYVRLKTPIVGNCYSHLLYYAPVKYILRKTNNTNCKEIELLEKSKELLKSIYLKKIN